MMKRKNRQIKGNTIIEVLIALAITSFCASLAVVIYLNVQKSSLPFFKIRAAELAGQYMKKAIREQAYSEDTYKAEEFSLKRTVAMHEQFPDCLVLRVLVFDGDKKKIYELERVVRP